ncbi:MULTISPECIES: class I SAM-dependent methyltransferase [Mycolicibacterium]|uniref:Putative S-adenosyl-L-methionine-dependent methyltransferase Mflv_5025 n=3 Tax=Mycolicibacterium gilvum TaxID=1804 RepID=Y5025_MYCGI|nr:MULTISPECIES: class I SAM-dependent methyltransferase [Mycolicibacterium]A4TEC9.1 RecName: Full=Putative S-adenosyl-L-methionine-dependent methyltransferase Mflv_5025 [Mycolicibacterium gilvum PYR-GCK]ABP47491.1 putative methyltransferase [Mycolicibacterium gilvum PYR-GCK]ADU00999.1 methyltransferase, putative, TIGR00027 family [Mycolicibacterium gilvum Spyr1]MBV5242551.1 class I SAM-dependent methyltransferase [Mycolicibacterium sp. PAM1]MCV7058651.1 class I SAM-dependent methyltransferase
MARTPDDSWDLASSVGATATMVAAGRAVASADPDPLINDPYAEPLVRAVGLDFFTRMLDGELDLSVFPDSSPERAQAMIDGMAVRTRFFDDCCLAAASAGVRQVVILAAGLDARTYRLPWPDGTVVYELDQPDVIAFKTQTLRNLGAEPAATQRPVPVDLREDWPAALRAAGFDATRPTAWLAEGLLIYLPPEAQDALFDTVTALSAPGSTLATEYVPGIVDFDGAKARALSEPLREHGLDIDMPSLVYTGARTPVMDHLRGAGWQVSGTARAELFARFGRPLPQDADGTDPLGEIVYVSATLAADA